MNLWMSRDEYEATMVASQREARLFRCLLLAFAGLLMVDVLARGLARAVGWLP